MVGREPRRVGKKSCLWVAGIQLGMGRAKTVEKGEGKKERVGLMGAWRWSGWCADKGSGFSIGPCSPMHTATVTDSNETIYKGMNRSLLYSLGCNRV